MRAKISILTIAAALLCGMAAIATATPASAAAAGQSNSGASVAPAHSVQLWAAKRAPPAAPSRQHSLSARLRAAVALALVLLPVAERTELAVSVQSAVSVLVLAVSAPVPPLAAHQAARYAFPLHLIA